MLILVSTLLVVTLAIRHASANRHVRSRALTSAVLFGGYVVIVLALRGLHLDPDLTRQLRAVELVLLTFGAINLVVTLAINPWRADRVPDQFPKIVQDAIIVALFVLAATMVVGRDFLAAAAAGAVIIGLALQDSLGNLFAGLSIQIEKPFRIGDWVNISGRDGVVTEVTWRATKIRTKAGNLVVVPNNTLARETITNYSEPTLHVLHEVDVTVSYDAAPSDVKAVIEETLAEEPLIDRGREIDVLTWDFLDSGIKYRIRVWTAEFDAHDHVDDRVRTRVYYAFRRHGIVIPYPTYVEIRREELPPLVADPSATAGMLKRTALFSVFDQQELDELASASRTVVYGAGETIAKQGAAGQSMFVIEAGTVRVRLAKSDRDLAQLETGDYFGEMSLLTGEPRNATVFAGSDCRLIEISAAAFRRVVLKDPTIVERVNDVMTVRRAELERHQLAIAGAQEIPEAPRTLLARMRRFLGLSIAS